MFVLVVKRADSFRTIGSFYLVKFSLKLCTLVDFALTSKKIAATIFTIYYLHSLRNFNS
ncbi:hypothetical protein J2W48_000831 [Flavobacterium piscis]|uniref:Uncharacterized protein n=1 Tax=Flavobacterium piscis TaxID=1114874 RepID=A0ABU1Y5T8_9FLAO|nr:hypothetical protein [Flavobacterium piscis]